MYYQDYTTQSLAGEVKDSTYPPQQELQMHQAEHATSSDELLKPNALNQLDKIITLLGCAYTSS